VAAVLGGLGSAVCFAISSLCASAASRRLGPSLTLAWVMLIGLALVGPPAVVLADASQLSATTIGLLALTGITNAGGLLIEYEAFRRGKVGVVTPIASTEGAVAAVIAVVAGLQLSVETAVLLGMTTVGVILAATHREPPDPDQHATGIRSAVLAMPVAILFGISLYTNGHLGQEISVWWVLLAARVAGTALLAAPLAARGSLKSPRSAFPLVFGAGAGEVVGILCYILGARSELAVSAVLSSLFSALAAIGAYFVFGERLTRVQLAGLVVIVVAISLLSV
jgi:drug/metabolite transporter (DMT)-like permease